MTTDIKKKPRYAVSVSGKTYARARAAVPPGSLASFVDDIITSALDDPSITARLIAKCQA